VHTTKIWFKQQLFCQMYTINSKLIVIIVQNVIIHSLSVGSFKRKVHWTSNTMVQPNDWQFVFFVKAAEFKILAKNYIFLNVQMNLLWKLEQLLHSYNTIIQVQENWNCLEEIC